MHEDTSTTQVPKPLAGKTLFITGASRGIGKAIALRAAADGANVVIAAKTAEPHPKLPGTIYTAADEIRAAGGEALPLVVDIRDDGRVAEAVAEAVARFGGLDILVNNASAISLTGTVFTPIKRYDLMHQVNARGTFVCSHYCIPHLLKADNPHVLNISPPLNMRPRWFKDHVAYTMAKYGMSMCVLGMAAEFADKGLAVNALWPQTMIATAAVDMLGGDAALRRSRTPEIMADAAYAILCRDSRAATGNFYVDEAVLRETGVTDFTRYAVDPALEPVQDYFLE
jgi:citronellol/citronellal dehydrogenase